MSFHPLRSSMLLAVFALAPACLYQGGSDSRSPASADAGADASSATPDAQSSELRACDAVDSELTTNCDLQEPCADFTGEEHACISDLMAREWERPPCEQYAECLDIPIFACTDTDAELTTNCGINDRPCNQMSWAERFCLSELMAQEWAQVPCDLYAECLDIALSACQDIDAELTTNCEIDTSCAQMSFQERRCISDLMSLEWAAPPCTEYQDCLQ